MRRTGTTVAAVHLRAGPGTDHPVLTTLMPKTSVDVIEQDGYWLHVHVDDQTGYVHSKFVLLEEQGVAEGFLRTKLDTASTPPPPAATALPPTPASGAASLADVPLMPPEPEMIRLGPQATGLEKLVAATWNKYGGLLTALSDELHIDPAVSVAVLAVESGGRGFGPDGRLLIRLENQIFFDKWGRNNPDQYQQHFTFDPEKRWMDHRWRPAPETLWREFHGDQSAEWEAFEFARSLSDTAAKLSISMGGPQIMGFNYATLGFESVQQMFEAFAASERNQIVGFFDFVQGPSADSRRVLALQERDFNAFASMYNGPGQAGKYGSLIRNVFDLFHQLQSA